jgi:prevent-host-death family protein
VVAIASSGAVAYHRGVICNISAARKNFEKLIDRALAGHEVILARRNDPVAELVPVFPLKRIQKKRRRKTK